MLVHRISGRLSNKYGKWTETKKETNSVLSGCQRVKITGIMAGMQLLPPLKKTDTTADTMNQF